MKYKVQGTVAPNVVGEFHLQDCDHCEWFEADSHLGAAAMFILNHPEVNCEPILVVDEEYKIGCYPLEAVKIEADFVVGLRG
jgi:hypothetical protein